MCGIAGLASFGSAAADPRDLATVRRMVGVLAPRGPDDEVVLSRGPLTLGFARLAVVDVAGGRQPFESPDGSVVLAVNGEIYNHRELAARLPTGTRLRSRSDGEVLLHLYQAHGLAFLAEVRGMFAVAVWDRTRNRLILARDRFGIKPLYYHRRASGIAFASEIKALLADPGCPRGVDWDRALRDPALTWEPIRTSERRALTWFTGVESVPPGGILQVDLTSGTVTEQSYWELPDFTGPATSPLSDGEFVAQYGTLLRSSVEDCLMSDAEIGVLLSGGIDSASIAALAGRQADLHTFSVLSATTIVNGDAEHAHLVAGRLGRPNHQVLFEGDRVPGAEQWRRLVWLQESPLCGAEQYYKYELYRYAKRVRPGLKVMLLGQGSDEFNGGYSADMSGGGEWPGFLEGLAAMRTRARLQRDPQLATWWDVGGRPLLQDNVLVPAEDGSDDGSDDYAAFVRQKYRDIDQYNCWHEDRSAAANGVEARVPFLDHRMVEFLAAIPAARRADLLWDKRILRAAMTGELPSRIVGRPKAPFVLGAGREHADRLIAGLFARSGRDLLDEALSGSSAAAVLDADGMRAALDRIADGRDLDTADTVLRLLNLGLLESMLSSPPSMEPTGDAEVPVAFPLSDWTTQREELVRLTTGRPAVTPDRVLAFAEGVQILRDHHVPTSLYLAQDAEIKFAIDADDAAAWSAFLVTVDGVATVEQVLDKSDARWADVEPFIGELFEEGFLTVVES